jgi:preprotein translocase subunit SecY
MSKFLDTLEPFYRWLPEVKAPEQQPSLNSRLKWTVGALLAFFAMGAIPVIGLDLAKSAGGQLSSLQFILASNIGTLITVGIGPIVLASIILQLLVGGKIINVDLSNQKDKARFSSAQKLLALILCFFESLAYVIGGLVAPQAGFFVPVVLQIALGSILLMYLDEVVSKYGISSGIGLFIAGGVASHIVWRMFNPFNAIGAFDLGNGSGLLFLFLRTMSTSMVDALIVMLPVLVTVAIFFIVVFVEGMHVNIPITMGRAGIGGRYPVKLLYVSNIPVILAAAFLANIQLLATAGRNLPGVGGIFNAVASFVATPHGLIMTMLSQLFKGEELFVIVPEVGQAILYLLFFTVICVVFGKLWVELAQGSEAVSEQLQRSGMSIPGFRRDPRVIRQVLDRYIPTITILGSVFVAVLAGFADLTNALGTGTGILLTVGIVYRLYEDLAKQQLFESNPMLAKLVGG